MPMLSFDIKGLHEAQNHLHDFTTQKADGLTIQEATRIGRGIESALNSIHKTIQEVKRKNGYA